MKRNNRKNRENKKNRQNRFARIQYKYIQCKKEADSSSEGTIRKIETALQKWQEYNPNYSIKDDRVNPDLILKFKEELRHGKGFKLSKNYKRDILIQLMLFFRWLSLQDGYKSRIKPTELSYFKPSFEDNEIRSTRRSKDFPTIEQVRIIIKTIPNKGVINLRDRAFIALLFCTGIRITAAVSLTLEMFSIEKLCFEQVPSIAKTKYAKIIVTPIFRFEQEMLDIIFDWYWYLKRNGFGNRDPLFPVAEIKQEGIVFIKSEKLQKEHISASQMSKLVERRCEQAIKCKFSPHKFRHACTYYAMEKATNALEIKAISQALGHNTIELVLQTYGALPERDLINTIRDLGRTNG